MPVNAGAGLSGDPGAVGHADQATQSTRRKSVSLDTLSRGTCIAQTFRAACEIMPNICYKPPMLTASSRRLPDVIFLNPMTDAETTALVERARQSMTLVLIAASREVEAAGSGDNRYAAPPIASCGTPRRSIRSVGTCC